MTNRTRTDSLLLAGFCAFLFFYGLGQFGLIGADEPRYAQVAREMLERHDWITPVLGGQPWLEKPPLYYWQAMLAYTHLRRERLGRAAAFGARCHVPRAGGLLFSAPLPARIRAGWRADHGFFRGDHRLRSRCLDGHGAGRGFHDGNARLVGLARERKENLSRSLLWLHGFGDAGEGAGRSISRVPRDRSLRGCGSGIATGY